MNEFDNLESVEEMMDYLVDNNEDSMRPNLEFAQVLQLLNVQTFLKLFARYKAMDNTERDEFDQCAEVYNDADNSTITRQSALAHICTQFFPETEALPTKEIIRKSEKTYQTPCSDCSNAPTHLIMFKTENRTEEHYLCEDCEATARAEEEDGE